MICEEFQALPTEARVREIMASPLQLAWLRYKINERRRMEHEAIDAMSGKKALK
jgi:hypothetical protein